MGRLQRLLLGLLLVSASLGVACAHARPPPPAAPMDIDNDGLLDVDDRCPADPETRNGFQDDDGCPDATPADRDHDSIMDVQDAAPTPEPEVGTRIEGPRIRLGEPLVFTGERLAPASHATLNTVADLLRLHPEIRRVSIEAHVFDAGDARRNLRTSQRRAEAVRRRLVSARVTASRLTARGLGDTHPISQDGTAEASARNTRVEFIIDAGGSR